MRRHIDRWLPPERASAIPTRVNAVEEISLRLHVPLSGKSWLNRELFEIAYGRLQHMDLPLRDVDDAWDRLQRLRTVYGVQLQSLIDYLVAPAGFWGHSAELP